MKSGDVRGLRLPALPGLGDAGLGETRRALEGRDPKESARQFETLFATMLVRELRRAMPKGMFGDGAGADVYEGWFDEHLGQTLGERDALGISALVRTSLERKLEAQASEEQQP